MIETALFVAAIATAMLSRCAVRPRARRVAVLFGNNYSAYPENELEGCHNDVRNIARELVHSGMFMCNEVMEHMDGTASGRACTKAGMQAALEALSARSHVEHLDVAYVHFSGHGDHTLNGTHECILPSDFETAGTILDDWLGRWAMSFHDRTRVVVVFDCCYSGDELELMKCKDGRKVMYLSGCRDDQTSEDAEGIDKRFLHTGAMTTCLVQVLRRDPRLFGDVRALHTELCAALKADGFNQVPVLTSTQNLKEDPTFIPMRSH